MGAFAGRIAFRIIPYYRQLCIAHLEAVFPDQPKERLFDIARQSYVNLGKSFGELFHMNELLSGKGKYKDFVILSGEEILTKALENGRGAVIITGHIGNWELMAAYIARRFPVSVVARTLYDPRIDRDLENLRKENGVNPIVRGNKDEGKQIINALKNGHLLGILMDQDTKIKSDFVPFLGNLAQTPVGPAILTLRQKVPAIPMFIFQRPNGGYQIKVHDPISRPSDDDIDPVKTMTSKFNDAISSTIREHPDQWVWMHRRWRHRPPGEKPTDNPIKYQPREKFFLPKIEAIMNNIIHSLSWEASDRLGKALGTAFYYLFSQRRKVGMQNLLQVFGAELTREQLKKILFISFQNLGRNMIEYVRIPLMDKNYFDSIEVVGKDLIKEAFDHGNGVLFLGGHIGSWEIAIYKLAAMGYPISIVAKELQNSYLNRRLIWLRKTLGVESIPPKDSIFKILRALKKGESVVTVLDQHMKDKEGIPVEFFGKKASTSHSTAFLTGRLKVPVLVGYSIRVGPGKHKLFLTDIVPYMTGKDHKESLYLNTLAYNRILEKIIRNHPTEWFWVHRRWKLSPDDAEEKSHDPNIILS